MSVVNIIRGNMVFLLQFSKVSQKVWQKKNKFNSEMSYELGRNRIGSL